MSQINLETSAGGTRSTPFPRICKGSCFVLALVLLPLGCYAEDSTPILQPGVLETSSPRPYDFRAQANHYWVSLWAPQAVASSLFAASFSASVRMVTSDFSLHSYYQRTARNLTRNAEYRSIEFGVSALTRQNTQLTSSEEHGLSKRAKYAAYHAFFVRDGDKDQFAYSRLAAAFGTAGLDALWHPGQKQHTFEWSEAGCLLGRYLLRSYWVEFKPDIKREGRKFLHRNATIPSN